MPPAKKTEPEPAPFSSLAAKLSYIQTHVDDVKKSGFNAHHKFHFVQEHGMFEVLRPLFRECNVSIVISPAERSIEKDSTRTIIHGSLTLLDGDSEQSIQAFYAGEGMDPQDKGTAKALTHFTKYALQKFFMIPTQEIDDSDNDAQSPEPKKASAPAKAESSAAKVDAEKATELTELVKHYVTEEKVIDGQKYKAKLATYRVSHPKDLTAEQFKELADWVASQVETGRA